MEKILINITEKTDMKTLSKQLYDLQTSTLQDSTEMEYSLKPVLYLGIVITSA